jgi:hypothetical protein
MVLFLIKDFLTPELKQHPQVQHPILVSQSEVFLNSGLSLVLHQTLQSNLLLKDCL